MQGIVRYVHQKSGDIVKYRVSTDVEGDKERFEDRKQNADEEHRAKYIKGLVFEVVEITDNLNERYVYYALPQSDRITYDKTVVDYIQEPRLKREFVERWIGRLSIFRRKSFHICSLLVLMRTKRM